MRILYVSFLITVASMTSYAQLWFDVGAKGMFGGEVLLNSNYMNDGGVNYGFGTTYAYGGKLGINLGYSVGLVGEYLFANSQQSHSYKEASTTFNNDIDWKSQDVVALLRYNGSGAYIEVGPRFSFVKEINQNDENAPDFNIENVYQELYKSAVLGFGGYIAGSSTLSIQLGVRVAYSFDDFVQEDSQSTGAPFPGYSKQYDDYQSSKPLSIMGTLEVNYAIGYLGRKHCGDRMRLINFE
jgi:hypothetical protein